MNNEEIGQMILEMAKTIEDVQQHYIRLIDDQAKIISLLEARITPLEDRVNKLHLNNFSKDNALL